MIAKLIAWSLSRRGLVAAFALALLVAGTLYVRTMPVDAIPDLSDVQVIVYTDYPASPTSRMCRSSCTPTTLGRHLRSSRTR